MPPQGLVQLPHSALIRYDWVCSRRCAVSARVTTTPTAGEELANTITHAIGVLLSIAATAVLTAVAIRSSTTVRLITYPVFGTTMIVLYTASTVYHRETKPELKAKLKVFDHVSIYFLIAGTYTPVTLIALPSPWSWSILGIIWLLAIAGTIFKLLFIGRLPVVSTVLYVAMGWTAVVAIVPLVRNLPTPSLVWLFAGGLFYTGGVGFYSWRRLPFNHAIWHLFVLAGTASHVIVVLDL
jgi:hemolysin III